MRRWLTRKPDLALDEKMVVTQRAIAFNTAMSYADNPNEIVEREKDGERLEEIRNNASAAMQLALLAQQAPGYDGGFIDVGVLSAAPFISAQRPSERAFNSSNDFFNPRVISKIIPKVCIYICVYVYVTITKICVWPFVNSWPRELLDFEIFAEG